MSTPNPNDPRGHMPPPPPPPDLPETDLVLIPHDEYGGPLRTAPAAPVRSNAGGCRYALIGIFGCAGILVLVVIALMLFIPAAFGGFLNTLAGSLGASVPPPIANVVSTQTIVTGIQPLGQLVSVSSQLAKADIQVSIAQGALNACGFSANHVVQGAVEAGIDLTRIGEDDLRYDAARDVYVLTIPQPEITSCRVDYIRQYERSFTTCAVDWDEARLLANYLTILDFRDTAVEGGILTRAENETRLVLGNFVRLLTGSQVEIIFEGADPLATDEPDRLPPSCAPDPPAGWSQNANGEWVKN